MNEYRVAVILATFNPEKYLIEQVESILSQKNVNLDVFIFDDGSTKGKDIICYLKDSHTNITVINNPPSGAPGRNFLRAVKQFDYSDYDFFAFSDQDDVWLPSKIESAISALVTNESNGYSSNLTLYDGTETIGYLDKSQPQVEFDYVFQGASAGCTYIIDLELFSALRRALHNCDVTKLSASVSHDWTIYYVCRRSNLKWHIDNNSYIYYRQHDNNCYGAKRGLGAQIQMFFGEWYKSNLFFMDSLPIENKFLKLNSGFFYKIKFLPKVLEFRRSAIQSLAAYIRWLFL